MFHNIIFINKNIGKYFGPLTKKCKRVDVPKKEN